MSLDYHKTASIAALLPIMRRKMKNCLLLMTELISTGMDANGSNHTLTSRLLTQSGLPIIEQRSKIETKEYFHVFENFIYLYDHVAADVNKT